MLTLPQANFCIELFLNTKCFNPMQNFCSTLLYKGIKFWCYLAGTSEREIQKFGECQFLPAVPLCERYLWMTPNQVGGLCHWDNFLSVSDTRRVGSPRSPASWWHLGWNAQRNSRKYFSAGVKPGLHKPEQELVVQLGYINYGVAIATWCLTFSTSAAISSWVLPCFNHSSIEVTMSIQKVHKSSLPWALTESGTAARADTTNRRAIWILFMVPAMTLTQRGTPTDYCFDSPYL